MRKLTNGSERILLHVLPLLKRCFRHEMILLLLLLLLSFSVSGQVITGAQQTEMYTSLLKGKRVAVVANHTSVINRKDNGYTHLVDSLVTMGVKVKEIFSPEHGMTGKIGAGEKVGDSKYHDIPVVSLYGKHLKPSKAELKAVDVVIFDMQDVGARFYTYISTLHYVMEACAEANKLLIVLDRPNPNGFYVDGPVLDTNYRSFVGMHRIPVVYGMTMGELAQMINSEGWIKGPCNLKVITLKNYTHQTKYVLPVNPSPNLTTMTAIYLYPTLCFFEGTRVSVARGTDKPFEMIGFPRAARWDTTFTPRSTMAAPSPMYKDTICSGFNLSSYETDSITELNLTLLIEMYQLYPEKEKFFNPFFDKLAGTNKLREQIVAGKSEDEIRASWQQDLDEFKLLRKKYLLYADEPKERK